MKGDEFTGKRELKVIYLAHNAFSYLTCERQEGILDKVLGWCDELIQALETKDPSKLEPKGRVLKVFRQPLCDYCGHKDICDALEVE